MEWLNYHHLLYFWAVVKEGGLAPAAARLRLAQPTISAQVRRLETVLGERLFQRRGRRLVLTDVGRVAYSYADEIFTLGHEMLDVLHGRATGRSLRFSVGIMDVIPKSIVMRLLEPAFRLPEPLHLVCREDRSLEGFLGELAAHGLDLVLSDAPAGPGTPVRLFSQLLMECDSVLLAREELAGSLRRQFPRSLQAAPLLLPGAGSMLRRAVDQWLESRAVRPRVVGEFDDTGLALAVAAEGRGGLVCPTIMEKELRSTHGLRRVGPVPVRQRFYAISMERRLKHPALVAVCQPRR